MNYTIEDKYKLNGNRPSKGCQAKYFRNNYWYKIDGSCNEGLNEHVVSLILKCSNYRNFVYYERCNVNGRKACRSYSFLDKNEEFIDISDIIRTTFYVSSAENFIWSLPNVEDRFRCIVEGVRRYTEGKIDYTYTLRIILYLDMFILNRDRHLSNLGIILNTETEKFRAAPIFDNGLSLLGGCRNIIFEHGIENAIQSQNARTISGSFIGQCLASTRNRLESPLKINFRQLNRLLNNEPVDRYIIEVLKYQYKNVGRLFEK